MTHRHTCCSLLKRTATFLTVALCPHAVVAQSVDYGALQDLFGQPVTTSVVGAPQRARDVPADMDIITADDIRRSGAIDIPGILAHVPGMDVSRWTNLGADVSVRGYDSPATPRLLVLINGRQVYLDVYGLTEWLALPVELSEIRQIEIVKGPNSALFGFNAAAGVINIITYNPLYDTVNTGKVTFGTQGYRDGSAVGTLRYNNVALRLSAGGTLTDDFRAARDFASAANLSEQATRSHLGADMHWQITPGSEAELEATYAADARLAETPIWETGYQTTENHSLRGRYTADTSVGIITGNAYTNWSRFSPQLVGQPPNDYKNVLTVATLQDVLKPAADHTVRLSTEYRNSTAGTAPVDGGHIGYNIAAVSAMWNWEVLPTLSLTASTRVDALWLDRSGTPLPGADLPNSLWNQQLTEQSYNFGAVWRPDQHDGLRLTVSRGVQLPSLIDLGVVQQRLGFFDVSGSPGVAPSVIENDELDWDRDLPGGQTQFRVALFHQTTSRFAAFDPASAHVTPSGYVLALIENLANSREDGAEFTLRGAFGRGGRWTLAYSPRAVYDEFLPGFSPANTGLDFAHTTPRQVVNASLGWSGGPWELDGFFRFQSSSAGLVAPAPGSYVLEPIGPVESFDARLGYRVNDRITLSLAGQNAFLSTARQTVFGKVQQRIVAAVSVGF